jgi:hypothetical protein
MSSRKPLDRLESALPPRLADWLGAIRRVRRAYRAKHGRAPRLMRPRRFTEKMQWRKLFDLDPRFSVLSDKLAVRDYITARVGPGFLIPLLWSGDDPDAVPLETLAPPFVVKPTHGSGHTLKVQRRENLDVSAARATFRKWLGYCHGTRFDEPGYVNVPHGLMVERMLLGPDGAGPIERRLYVFAGKVRATQTTISSERRQRNAGFHDRDWQHLNWRLRTPLLPGAFPRPRRYDDMVALAERLAADFDHVRVDFYDLGERIWIGELTLYSFSGMTPFNPVEADEALGSYWPIRRPGWRAAAAVLWRRREVARIGPAEIECAAGRMPGAESAQREIGNTFPVQQEPESM